VEKPAFGPVFLRLMLLHPRGKFHLDADIKKPASPNAILSAFKLAGFLLPD